MYKYILMQGYMIYITTCAAVSAARSRSSVTAVTLRIAVRRVSCGIHIFLHMGWLRSVGSIKLYVSFAEYRLFYRSLLQKRPIILSILLIVATPHRNMCCIL